MGNTMDNSIDYSSITESPNLKATQEQLARLYQRYHFARQFAKDKDVLEVACGSGIGLGYLAQVATSVVGGDIDEKNVDLARENYKLKDEREYREVEKLRRWEDRKLGGWEDIENEKMGVRCEKQKHTKNEKLKSCEDGKSRSWKIDIQLMDAHDLNFSDKCFDLVLLYEAIYYLKDPAKFISEAGRVLRKDGKLII